ncbi:beta-class phenol-soluble modulin [Staphylococcus warneri]|nr:beta-class phenol-soluble modulin [Staphylococcus warneri]MCG6249191.1 beta-class phenol-soluble modulin [Staphylococcus warneri]
MTKLAEAIANTVKAAQGHDGAKLGTSIVSIVENGVSVLGKLYKRHKDMTAQN